MKKIFTLIAVALLGGAVSVNAEGEYVYNVPAGTTVIDSDVLNAAISEAAGNTAIKLVHPAGTYDVNGTDATTGGAAPLKLNDNYSFIFSGTTADETTLNFPKTLNIEGTHGTVGFENVSIKDTGCQYFINQSKECNVTSFYMTDCKATDFERSIIRTQGSVNVAIGSIVVDDCIFTNIASTNEYSVFYFGTATTKIGKLELKNSTFDTTQRSFIEASKAPITEGVFITNCTFYNNVADGRYFMDANGQSTNLTMTNSILGKSNVVTAKGARSAGTITFTNCLRTSDCVYKSNNISLEADTRSSADIFTDPDNHNFTLKIADKIGDPRWISTAIKNIATETEANANAPIYNLAGQQVSKDFKGVCIQNGKKFINK